MVGHPDADRLALRVLQPSRGLASCLEQERIGTGSCRLEQPELARIDPRIAGDFPQIAAHEREVMVLVGTTQTPESLEGTLVPQMRAQCIAAIRWIGDQSAIAHDLDRLADQTQLRVLR